jgi:hypothetical protein
MLVVEEMAKGITFLVTVQPRAKKNEIVGVIGDALKIRLTAPPVQGAANEQCRKLLAETLQVNRAHVVILSGLHGRQKRLQVVGMTKERLLQRLSPYLG